MVRLEQVFDADHTRYPGNACAARKTMQPMRPSIDAYLMVGENGPEENYNR